MRQEPIKIVLTGAPSSGKSTAMRALAEIFGERIALVPESAVVLLAGGYPAPPVDNLQQIEAFQLAILEVQAGLELASSHNHRDVELVVLDRASLDGAGFWPPGPDDFLKKFWIDREREYRKFSHVLFLELPGPAEFGGVGKLRFHDFEQSLESERRLKTVWGDHRNFQVIEAKPTLEEKTRAVVAAVEAVLNRV